MLRELTATALVESPPPIETRTMDNRIFHVTIKGLFFRPTQHPTSELLLIQERSGNWELPGGRLEHGEDFSTALRRECQEEMGVTCDVLDKAPFWAWSALGGDGIWKVVLCFRIALPHLEFTRSDECTEWDFFGSGALASLKVSQQLRPLIAHFAEIDP
jgi:8-oxo-dGTP pyrophosphatase MutT (NUDIX family)